nr:hypothetical protein [Tanacetum cinerariifolium]
PLSPAYVPDPMELDEHVPVYVPEPEHPEYHAPSDDDIQVEDDNEDPEKDLEEDPSEEHEPENDDEDPEEDPNEEHKSKGSEETESFEEDEIAITPPPPRHRGAKISYDFVDTVEAGQGLIRSPGHDTQTIARAADRVEDASYVKALQASERRMMTSIEEVNLREVHQAYLSFEAQNRELLARLETLETHISRMEWQRQSVEDLAVTQMMRIHTLEARARTDTVEDTDSS